MVKFPGETEEAARESGRQRKRCKITRVLLKPKTTPHTICDGATCPALSPSKMGVWKVTGETEGAVSELAR